MAKGNAAVAKALVTIAKARGFSEVVTTNRQVQGNGHGIEIVVRYPYRSIASNGRTGRVCYNEGDITKFERELWGMGLHPRQGVAK